MGQENFLNNHIHYVKLIGDLVTKLKRAGDGLGIHMVDNDIARMVTYTANKVATTTSTSRTWPWTVWWSRWWAGEGPTGVPKDIVRYMSHYNNKERLPSKKKRGPQKKKKKKKKKKS